MTVSRIALKIVLDIFFLIFVGCIILIFRFGVKPFHRGFFCDDETIRYPYLDSTITTLVLAIVGLGVPISSILLVEYWHCYHMKSKNQPLKAKILFNKNVHPFLWYSYCRIGVFLFGAAVNVATTDVGKYTIGRLRPHFISVCQPVLPEHCNHTYITEYQCQNDDLAKIREARLSFPSGHSSLAAYCMVFVCIYLHIRMRCQMSILLKPVILMTMFCLAFYTGLSRISDYKHHWSDVLSGFILGTLVAVVIAMCVSDLIVPYKKSIPSQNDDPGPLMHVGGEPNAPARPSQPNSPSQITTTTNPNIHIEKAKDYNIHSI